MIDTKYSKYLELKDEATNQEELLYAFLKAFHTGYKNRVKGSTIRAQMNIRDDKTMRKIIENCRLNKHMDIICSKASSDGGYWIATSKQEAQETIDNLKHRAQKILKTARTMQKRIN